MIVIVKGETGYILICLKAQLSRYSDWLRTGWPRGHGIPVSVRSRIFTSYRPDRFLDPPNLLSDGYPRLFPGSKAAGACS
jgi:hypothetical protein